MNQSGCGQDLLLDNAMLDTAHDVLHRALHTLAHTPQERFRPAYLAVVAAIEREFRGEEEMMERLGYQGLAVHREQHARALSGLHHAQAALDEGDPEPARRSIGLLGDWLSLHIPTMDAALAAAWAAAHAGSEG